MATATMLADGVTAVDQPTVTAEQHYRQLVVDLSNGKEVDGEKVHEVLEMSGRQPATFQQHVSMLRQRLEAVDLLESVAELEQQKRKAEREKTRAREALKVYQKETSKRLAELRKAFAKAAGVVMALDDEIRDRRSRAKRTLHQTADPAVVRRIDVASAGGGGTDFRAEVTRMQQQQLDAVTGMAWGTRTSRYVQPGPKAVHRFRLDYPAKPLFQTRQGAGRFG
jgi:hypothetical protein